MRSEKLVVAVLGFIAGAAAGAVTMHFVDKRKEDERVEDKINAYMEMIQDEYNGESSVNPPRGDEDSEEELEDDDQPKKSRRETLVELMKDSGIKPKNHDYTKHYEASPTYKKTSPVEMAAKYEHPEDDEEDPDVTESEVDPDEVLDEVSHRLDDCRDPFVIPAEDMGNSGNDIVILEYYLGDNSLVEGDHEVYNVDQLLGECLDGYLASTDSESVEDLPSLYVRNEVMIADYEVNFVNGSWIN